MFSEVLYQLLCLLNLCFIQLQQIYDVIATCVSHEVAQTVVWEGAAKDNDVKYDLFVTTVVGSQPLLVWTLVHVYL